MKKNIFILIVAVFSLFSCGEEVKKATTLEELRQQRLEDKLNRWKKSTLTRCTEDMLAKAGAEVDSILIAQARLGVDSIAKPERPIKPEKPEIKEPKDTLPIAPILEE